MMRQLGLNEGDPVRLNGTTLPKGTFVKIQPQTVDFLEISDPKAVLEQAFRNFSCLTKGDIVEISYNCLTFEILIMETVPDADAILIIDTDLNVDFAPPKGYVEPAPKPRPPPPTMASKLGIDNKRVESVGSSGTSTPSAAGGNGAGESSNATASTSANTLGGGGGAFRGSGQSLSGKKSKGKKERTVEPLDPFSMVRRTDRPNIVTNDTQVGDKKVPAALNLPMGKLYFGYDYIPLGGNKENEDEKQKTGQQRITFSGQGQTLSGRAPRQAPLSKEDEEASGAKPEATTEAGTGGSTSSPFGGQGQTLGSGSSSRTSRKRDRGGGKTKKEAIVVDDSD